MSTTAIDFALEMAETFTVSPLFDEEYIDTFMFFYRYKWSLESRNRAPIFRSTETA